MSWLAGFRPINLRTGAIEAAGRHLSGNALADLAASHRADPHRMVRQRVLEIYVQRFPHQAMTPLSDALLDASASIRQYARYYLEQMGEGGFLKRYRELAEGGETRILQAGLRGLGDIGEPRDAQLILPHLASPSSKTRRLALRALGHVAPAVHREHFLAALEDEIPSNSRMAADIVSEDLDDSSLGRLLNVYIHTRHHHTRAVVLRIFDNLEFWSRLEYLLRAATASHDHHPHPDLNERIARYLTHWASRVNYVYTTPSASQRESVEASLEAMGADFPSWLVGVIREILERKG